MRSGSLTRLKFGMADYLFAKSPDVDILLENNIFRRKVKVVSINYRIKHMRWVLVEIKGIVRTIHLDP